MENLQLHKDLPENAHLHGTELVDVLYTNCIQDYNGQIWKNISGCSFNMDLLTRLAITDHNRWSWQIPSWNSSECLGNAMAELG